MSLENQNEESKSLRLVAGPGADFSALATTCVCFANASGGRVRLASRTARRCRLNRSASMCSCSM